MKDNYDHMLLLKHMPKEFNDILNHIKSLGYSDKPDYEVGLPIIETKRRTCLALIYHAV